MLFSGRSTCLTSGGPGFCPQHCKKREGKVTIPRERTFIFGMALLNEGQRCSPLPGVVIHTVSLNPQSATAPGLSVSEQTSVPLMGVSDETSYQMKLLFHSGLLQRAQLTDPNPMQGPCCWPGARTADSTSNQARFPNIRD